MCASASVRQHTGILMSTFLGHETVFLFNDQSIQYFEVGTQSIRLFQSLYHGPNSPVRTGNKKNRNDIGLHVFCLTCAAWSIGEQPEQMPKRIF